jgi:hypothetical protein
MTLRLCQTLYELTENKAATGDGSYPREPTIFVLKLKKDIKCLEFH